MRAKWMNSTLLVRMPVAFNSLAPVPYGSQTVNHEFIKQLIAAGEIAAGQGVIVDGPDLGARSRDSEFMLEYWDRAEDIITGYKAIKEAGKKYLPKFADEQQTEYDARLELTKYTNIFADTCDNLAAKPFEEEVSLVAKRKDEKSGELKDVVIPPEILSFIEDVDGAGNNLTSYSATTFFNGIAYAIDWIYVDYPKRDPSVRTQADAKAAGIRPFWSHVLGRNVLEVRSHVIGGAEKLTYMRILEPGDVNHIRIFERNADGFTYYALFMETLRTDGKAKIYTMVDSGVITIGEIPLVPFATGRRNGRTYKFKPALRGALDLAVEHYQAESGLKFAKVMTAYPMLAANGIKPRLGPDGKPLKLGVGPHRVLYGEPDGNGNAGSFAYVSPDAACLAFLAKDVEDIEKQMRELGKQPLTANSSNLTVITTAYAAGKSKTAVGAWGNALKDALENALRMTCLWFNINTYEPEVDVYSDYEDFTTDQGADLSELGAARTRRDLSRENYFKEMKRRNVIRADFDDKENDAQLLTETPTDQDIMAEDDTEQPPGNKPPAKKPVLVK